MINLIWIQTHGDMDNYLQNVWAAETRVPLVERITVNGMNGATGVAQIRRETASLTYALSLFSKTANGFFGYCFIPQNLTKQLATVLRERPFRYTISAGKPPLPDLCT